MKSSAPTDHPRRLVHFSPLRYPGGKGKLAPYIKTLIKRNGLLDCHYVEPYCGGAAVALELLFHEYVSHIHINDLSKPVYAFWKSVLTHTDQLCRLVRDTPLTVKSWDKQKRILANQADFGTPLIGFAAFFLNRTNRSGIFNGGIIGGRDQTGHWKIDARFNREELIFRIESIAKMRDRVTLTRMDALKFLSTRAEQWPAKTLIYLDPPYYVKGRHLYYDFYQPNDHDQIHSLLVGSLRSNKWVVSYDDVPSICKLYSDCRGFSYSVRYSSTRACEGSEVMFFSDAMQWGRAPYSRSSC
jgi:DNA adenine methylase